MVDEEMVDPEAARRQAMLPPGVAWNARVAAARRMATEGCQPQHLALEEPTWNAATTLAREVLVRAESVDEDRDPLPFNEEGEMETLRVQQLARAILAYDPFPQGPTADSATHPVQELSLEALAEYLGRGPQGGLDGLADIVLPAASRDDRLRGILLDPAKSTEFPFETGHKLRHVRTLSLEGIQLVSLPDDLSRMKSLTSLQMSRNRLLSVPDEICNLKLLVHVGLSHNYLRALPSNLGQLKRLTTLHVHCNRLAKLPMSMQDMNNLTDLTLYGNELKVDALPISRKAALKALSLSDNRLGSLPDLVDPAARLDLTEIQLERNELTAFPKISLLGNVTELWLSSNRLFALPPEIGQLVKLKVLALDDNQLPAVPPSIGQLTGLRELGLASNLLSAVPAEIGDLARLKELRLDNNSLQALPAQIVALSQLSYLTVAGNRLTALPQGIGALVRLRALEVGHNLLTELTEEIGSLTKLTRLGVAHNELTELPQSIASCKALVSLSVHDNQLRTLPTDLPAKLTELPLHNNPVLLEFSTAEIRALFSAVTVEEAGDVTREGLTSFISELTREDSTAAAKGAATPEAVPLATPSPAVVPTTPPKHASRIVTKVEGDQVTVTIHEQGKLGLNFGATGATWPAVESIATDGLCAQHPELTAGMRIVRVSGQNGPQDVEQLSLIAATEVFRAAGFPVTLTFKKPTAAAETSAHSSSSSPRRTPRRSPRSSRGSSRSPQRSPRRLSARKLLLPETAETVALKKKLKLTAPDAVCSQLTSESSLKFEEVRDVFRDPLSLSASDVSKWLTPSPSQDLSRHDGNTSRTRPSTQHYFTQDATAVRNLESPRRLRASEGWHIDAGQQKPMRRPGSGAIRPIRPVGVGYQNAMAQASKLGIPGGTAYGISNFIAVPSCTVRELLLLLPGGPAVLSEMEDSDLDRPLLHSTAEAIRVAHAHELSTDTSSTHPEDLAASSIVLQ
jgi:Leucine-rich repeat (LRR) protein